MNHTEHILTCMAEECLEVAKDISKSLRFGLDDVNVLQSDGPTNRARIIAELNDLMAVVDMATRVGIIPMEWSDPEAQEAKKRKVRDFMYYARQKGTLE